MRILQIIPYYFPAFSLGGTVHCVFELSQYLKKRGHDVSVYASDLFDGKRRLLDDDKNNHKINHKVRYFRNVSNALAFNQHIFFPLGYFFFLSRDIQNFDIIHFHEVNTIMHLYASLLAQLHHIPYVVTTHGTTMEVKEAGRSLRKRIVTHIMGKYILSHAKKVIAITRNEKKSLIQLGISGSRIKLIPNGVKPLVNKLGRYNRNKYKIKNVFIEDKKRKLLFMGRIHPKKGLFLLFQLIAELKKRHANVRLMVAGPIEDHKYYSRLEAYRTEKNLEKEIVFLGIIDENMKQQVFRMSDMFVLPSYGEVLSISALEAASYGLPLLVSEECGLAQISNYDAGTEVKPTLKGLLSGYYAIVHKKNYKMYYRKNAQKMISEQFDIQINVKHIENVYEHVLNE